MGCDIHCYVEHAPVARDSSDTPRRRHWFSFGGRINPGRNYLLFSLLAGPRGSQDPLIAPRGLPDDLGVWAKQDAWLYIRDTEDADAEPHNCSRKNAERWHASYGAQLLAFDEETRSVVPTTDAALASWVQHPDWHTHSWLTLEEFEKVLDRYLEITPTLIQREDEDLLNYWRENNPSAVETMRERIGANLSAVERARRGIVEYRALLASMKTLAENGDDVRLVFWFDN